MAGQQFSLPTDTKGSYLSTHRFMTKASEAVLIVSSKEPASSRIISIWLSRSSVLLSITKL